MDEMMTRSVKVGRRRRVSHAASSTRTGPGLAYRRDIDGLRALAVLSVVFFHADFVGFDGGFVGVDIFFVISGYLITSIIVDAVEAGQFSVAWFYERRIRRIIPAFIVMVVATSMASMASFPPKELAQFGLSAAAAAAFCSNIFFARQIGYFAGSEKMMPLLHTWSLGVEEQFYIVWPLVLLACHRLGLRRGLKVLVVAVAIASLAYAQWSTTRESADRAFYLLQSRACELMLGAMLGLGMAPAIKSRWLRDLLGWLGIGMMAFAITRFSASTPFPGLWAAIPCLGAAFVIHAGQNGDTAVSKLLSLSPCVFIGLISYSLYLWHWPIFAFAENYLYRAPTLGETCALIVASIAIATASWRYVELPFRFGKGPTTLSPHVYLVGGLGALLLVACFGGALFRGGGLPGRLGSDALRFNLAISKKNNPLRRDCHTEGTVPPEAARCIRPAPNAGGSYDIIVWGDSHADAISPAIVILGEKYGLSTRQATKSGCPPLIGVDEVDQRNARNGCREYNNALLKQLQQEPRPSSAILASRWSGFTETGGAKETFLIDDQNQTLDAETSRSVLARGLERTVDAINALGITVLLVGQAPEFYGDPNACFVRRAMYHGDANDCLRLPRQAADQRLRTSNAILVELANSRSRTMYVGLDTILCDKEVCWAMKGDQPLYADNNHLNLSGARVVGAALSDDPDLRPLLLAKGIGAASAGIHPVGN